MADQMGNKVRLDSETEAPSRDTLVWICENGSVPQDRWRNRDTAGAQRQVGECLMLLLAGCDFTVKVWHPERPWAARTYYVTLDFQGFDAFEYGRDHTTTESFYLPTVARLERANGGDWY